MTLLEHIKVKKTDAVRWQIERWMPVNKDDVNAFATATEKVIKLLRLVRNEFSRGVYIDFLVKVYKVDRKTVTNQINRPEDSVDISWDEEAMVNLPPWMDREEVLNKGFCAVKTDGRVGYYGMGAGGKVQISNFIIHPIFHVYNKEDSRHIFEVENDRKRRAVLDVPSRALVSLETLQNCLVGEGNFIFFGSKPQLLRIATELLSQFPMCKEITQLGWQPEGFYAFVNKIYLPAEKMAENANLLPSNASFKEPSKWGTVEFAEKNYLIPAASEVYKHMRIGEDIFENDRVMEMKQSPVSFADWGKQMHKVYQEKGLIGIAYIFVTLFRDIVFSIDHNCPHLYGYGEKGSGKSKWAESITAFFYVGRTGFQLNSGTDFAFFNYMQRFRNCPAHLNEFDEKDVRPEWFQSIKGIYDGEGRERGRMGSRNRTEVQRVDGTLILTGQYIVTKDDNSVVSRSIICPFFEKQFTDQEKKEYDKLRLWQEAGITSLVTDILAFRSYVKEHYYLKFNEILGNWRRGTNEQFNQRVFQNWCHLATMWYLFKDLVKLPVSFTAFEDLAYKQALYYSKFIRDTDTLTEFWNSVEYLLDQQLITEGWDFKIITTPSIKLRAGNHEETERLFDGPKKLLLIRLNNVHKLYQESYKKRTGKEAMSLENLMHYFTSRSYYIGSAKQSQFKRYTTQPVEQRQDNGLLPPTTNVHFRPKPEVTITTAYVFDFNALNCDLERSTEKRKFF